MDDIYTYTYTTATDTTGIPQEAEEIDPWNLKYEYKVEDDLVDEDDDEDDLIDEEILGLIENFIKAYNVPENDKEKIVLILEKKNSKRSKKEKEIISEIVRSKKDIPKIEIERQEIINEEKIDDTNHTVLDPLDFDEWKWNNVGGWWNIQKNS